MWEGTAGKLAVRVAVWRVVTGFQVKKNYKIMVGWRILVRIARNLILRGVENTGMDLV